MNYFVTGATGFIGGRVARLLVEAGHNVVALVRTPSKARDLADLGVTIAPGDITDRNSMRAPVAGVEGVFHIAAWYKIGARDVTVAERINVEGTRNVLSLMIELGIPKGVYTSTIAVHSDTKGALVDESYRYEGAHLSAYDRTKWRAHYEVALPMMAEGLPLVIVQPSLVYGPGDTSTVAETFRQYLKGRLPVLPLGTTLCWAHVDDIAHGHLLAMEKGRPGECYHLAGPVASMVEVFEIARQTTGKKAPRIRLGAGVMRGVARVMDVVSSVVTLPETYAPETLRVTAGTSYIASCEKAKRELGFATRPIEEGLRETLDALMDEVESA